MGGWVDGRKEGGKREGRGREEGGKREGRGREMRMMISDYDDCSVGNAGMGVNIALHVM